MAHKHAELDKVNDALKHIYYPDRAEFMRVAESPSLGFDVDERNIKVRLANSFHDAEGNAMKIRAYANDLFELLMTGSPRGKELAFGSFYMMLNSDNRLISELGAEKFRAAILLGDEDMGNKCVERLQALVLMDYRKWFNPGLRTTGSTTDDSMCYDNLSYNENVVVVGLEQTRNLAGRTLASLIGHKNSQINTAIWHTINTAVESGKPEIMDAGNEMLKRIYSEQK